MKTWRMAAMRRQGVEWVLMLWDPGVQAWREGAEWDYHTARRRAGEINCPANRGGKCRNPRHQHSLKGAAVR